MRRLSLLFAALALFAQSSAALAGSSTLAVTPGSGATLRVGTDGSTNFFGNGAICDGAACALLASVNAAGTPGTNGLAIQGLTGGVPVPISAASLPLPTGASTAAGLTTINTTLGSPFQAGGSIGNTTFAATESGTWTVQPGNTANTTPWLFTGSGTAGSAASGVVTVQGIASMTPFLVNPGTAANWGVVAQASTTSGQSGQLALGAVTTSPPSYTTAQTDPLSLDTAGNLRINCITGCSSSSSITGWAGGTIGTGTIQAFGATQGTIGTGLVPALNAFIVNTLASIAWSADGVANTTTGSPTTSLLMASNGTTVDRLQDDANKNLKVVLPSTQAVADPCMFQAKTKVAFSTTSGSTQLVALSGSTKIYVCAVHFITTSADSISFTEGTGTACATGATAVSGSTTAASGMDFPALGGMTEGGGVGTVMNTSVAGDEFCLLQSGTTKIAGNLEVVQQ